MLMGDDTIQLRSLYVFGLEVIHVVVRLFMGQVLHFIWTVHMFSGCCDILSLTYQRNIPLEKDSSRTRIVWRPWRILSLFVNGILAHINGYFIRGTSMNRYFHVMLKHYN